VTDSPNELIIHQVFVAMQTLLSVSPPFGYLCDDAKGGVGNLSFGSTVRRPLISITSWRTLLGFTM